jgi:hypothetical protein
MAKVYPILKPELNNGPEENSEKKTYAALAQYLSDDYRVFFSIDWSGKEAIHGSQDYECDFIVFHPTKGILVIEVKGGGIRYDGKYDLWESKGRKGNFKIKNPIKQALKNKHALKSYLFQKFEEQYGRRTHLRLAHCVWFIDTDYNEGVFPRGHQDIILDRSSVQNLTERISKAYAFYDDENKDRNIPKDDYQKLMALLLPSGELKQSIVKNLEYGEVEIFDLTNEQLKLLKSIRKQKKVFISGGAGTGKTLLGFEKAKEEAQLGKKVLYTCYSRPVAESMEKNNPIENVTIMNFHKLCHEYGKKIGKGDLFELKENYTSSDFWNYTSIEILEEAIISLGEESQFDTIIVDEVQDFSPTWLNSITSTLIKDQKDGCIYLLGDKSQSIFDREDFEAELEGFFTFELFENLRNTKEIFNCYDSFTHNGCEAHGPNGDNVHFVKTANENIVKQIEKEVNKLVSQKLSLGDITVLSGSSPNKALTTLIENNKFTTDINEKSKVLLSTIHSFKGLENKVIIISNIDKIRDEFKKELLYVACSRAKHILIVIGDEKDLALFQKTNQQEAA